jgi:hypothetical protein
LIKSRKFLAIPVAIPGLPLIFSHYPVFFSVYQFQILLPLEAEPARCNHSGRAGGGVRLAEGVGNGKSRSVSISIVAFAIIVIFKKTVSTTATGYYEIDDSQTEQTTFNAAVECPFLKGGADIVNDHIFRDCARSGDWLPRLARQVSTGWSFDGWDG